MYEQCQIPPPPPKSRVIKYNLVYRLRKKGFKVISREHTIIAAYLSQPMEVRQIRRLVNEYNYTVQFEI
jgi:predicted kinase